MPNDMAAMPDPDLKNLHDQFVQQVKHLEEQHTELKKARNNLTMKIEELEHMIEALSAGISSAAQHFPHAEPSKAPYPNDTYP